jgi:NAD(P)-dependent dehydrogenase (short-subunit alcohol dehydrogenase family)
MKGEAERNVQSDMKTVMVTGAAGALGAAVTRQACERGWRVLMIDRDTRGLNRVFDAIDESTAGEPVLQPMDLAGATPDDVDEMLDSVKQVCGGLDAIVHCAVWFSGLTPLEHYDPAEWLMHMQVNLNTPWLICARALPLLREADAGKIVFLLEDLEKVSGPLWGAYGVSKRALATLAGQLAAETRNSGIEVRAVNPGPMQSGIRSRVYHSENPHDVPEPAVVARRIMDYLDGLSHWDDLTVDLSSAG